MCLLCFGSDYSDVEKCWTGEKGAHGSVTGDFGNGFVEEGVLVGLEGSFMEEGGESFGERHVGDGRWSGFGKL